MELPRIIAVFQPQAWVNDYAHEIDGRKEFDCTNAVLRLTAEEIKKLEDDQYNTDDLLPSKVMGKHSGPFYVNVQNAVDEFFAIHNLEITEESLTKLRKLYKVHSPKRKRA